MLARRNVLAVVSFKNVNEQHTVILDLVNLSEGWRIVNITWDRKATLRGVLSKK